MDNWQLSLNLLQLSTVNCQLSIAWWAQVDSNHRPHAYQACALTTWAMRPLVLINGARPSSRGGDEEDRTPDPLRARQVLSQLSYTPICIGTQAPSYASFVLKLPLQISDSHPTGRIVVLLRKIDELIHRNNSSEHKSSIYVWYLQNWITTCYPLSDRISFFLQELSP